MDPKEILDTVGQKLMRDVRDRSIEQWEMLADGELKGNFAHEMMNLCHDILSSPNREVFKEKLLPAIVDTVLHYFLFLVESDSALYLVFSAEGKGIVSLQKMSDGLAGELYTREGWIQRFSTRGHIPPG